MSLSHSAVLHADCLAAREVLSRVGDKWSVFVISLLGDGPKRFSEIKRTIEGISQRMLTLTLRGLERDGLVDDSETPSKVESLGRRTLVASGHEMGNTTRHAYLRATRTSRLGLRFLRFDLRSAHGLFEFRIGLVEEHRQHDRIFG